MFHTLAWYNSAQADIVLTDAIPIPDEIFLIQNANFVPQFDYDILFAAVFSTTLLRSQITSATIRQFSPVAIRPMGGTLIPGDQPNVADYRNAPVRVSALEELIVQNGQTTGGAVDVATVMGVTRNFIPAPVGSVFTMRVTSATAATADVWSNIAATFADNLPTGRYAVVGLNYFAVGAIAARLIFEDSIDRPGCIAGTLAANATAPMFNGGGLGKWGEFSSNRPPNIQVLCNAATAVHELALDFIRIA